MNTHDTREADRLLRGLLADATVDTPEKLVVRAIEALNGVEQSLADKVGGPRIATWRWDEGGQRSSRSIKQATSQDAIETMLAETCDPIEMAPGDLALPPVEDGEIGEYHARKRRRMLEDVAFVFKSYMRGATVDRDWEILRELARASRLPGQNHRGRREREGSLRSIGKQFGISKDAVADRRDLQISAIADRIAHLVPSKPTPIGAHWPKSTAPSIWQLAKQH